MSTHVTILAAGTRGDVQPYVALALGLLGAGHEVTMAANAEFRPLVEAYGVPYRPLRADYLALADTPEGREALCRCSRRRVRSRCPGRSAAALAGR